MLYLEKMTLLKSNNNKQTKVPMFRGCFSFLIERYDVLRKGRGKNCTIVQILYKMVLFATLYCEGKVTCL